jgi:DNA processing protein
MCSNIIVVESNESGGSMITAHMGNEYGRNVLAVPGRIDQGASKGCHTLIRQGATLVSCMDHILEELNYSRQRALEFDEPKVEFEEEVFKDPVERCVVNFLREKGSASLDEISETLTIPIHHLLPRLKLLELHRTVQCDRDGSYIYGKH